MELVVIVGLILLGAGLILFFVSISFGQEKAALFGLAVFLTAAVMLCVNACDPSAMNVYQGKTELKYSVIGKEKVDSAVVFKPENKKK
jgi:type IV secretory pathway TrbD component